jgi:uncharacterized protein (TIGR04255 family)
MMPRSYKKPCIEEAICEFTFAPTPAMPDIDLTLPGNLQAKLGKDLYPGPTRQVVNRTHLVDPQGVQITEQLFRVQLPSKGERTIVAIGRDVLSVSRIRPYDGWENFKPEIRRVLEAWPDVVSTPRNCVRVGLRYINRLITPPGKLIDHWLNDVSPPLAAKAKDGTTINGRLHAINNRREFNTEDGRKVIISLATLEPVIPNSNEYLIDIDALADVVPLDNLAQIIELVEKLHTITGAVFETLITDNTRDLLDAQ